MADIRPFRGIRYDSAKVGALEGVTAPPYDVISDKMQDALEAKSSYNCVRIILNRTTDADGDNDNRYTRSAALYTKWLGDGALVRDEGDAVYVYSQEFEAGGTKHIRTGFIARVGIEPLGEGTIFPHEDTLPGPKMDRLKLMRACNANFSQIFSLFPDDKGAVNELLATAMAKAKR